MNTIKIFPLVGNFGENKDIARDIRIDKITPILNSGEEIILDFDGVDSITQSFGHALLSELIRNFGIDVLDRISFSNCSDPVSKIIEIIVDYMQ
jgi:hypothetical protein